VHRYGYFEARMRAPRGSSMVTGFFTFTRPHGRRSWDEIDIEILGRDTRSILFSYFNDGERRMHEHQLGFDAAEGFHTYAFEWTPRYIRWYVDGRLSHEATGAEVPIPDAPQRLYLNLWNSETLTSWVGPLPTQGSRWTLRVSCLAHAVRYRGQPLCRS
jgi:beta-glucanase (GH16 family)